MSMAIFFLRAKFYKMAVRKDYVKKKPDSQKMEGGAPIWTHWKRVMMRRFRSLM